MNHNSIIKIVKPDKHTEYMACAQYADWIPKAFNGGIDKAFIVQEIRLIREIDGHATEAHYYEAWRVENNKCERERNQDSDDLFCIGHPMDDGDALKESIGHRGKVSFIPRVFLINEKSSLYSEIQSWPTNVVREANGLRACEYTSELAKRIEGHNEYTRIPFYHEWDFVNPIKIHDVVLRYCNTMYHPDDEIDRENFKLTIDYFFPEGTYPEIKQRIIDKWETNNPA